MFDSSCVTQSCVLIDTLLSNKARCASVISILMTHSQGLSGPVHIVNHEPKASDINLIAYYIHLIAIRLS